jgi:hypothetical protein
MEALTTDLPTPPPFQPRFTLFTSIRKQKTLSFPPSSPISSFSGTTAVPEPSGYGNTSPTAIGSTSSRLDLSTYARETNLLECQGALLCTIKDPGRA